MRHSHKYQALPVPDRTPQRVHAVTVTRPPFKEVDRTSIWELACRAKQQWGVYVFFTPPQTNEDHEALKRAMPAFDKLSSQAIMEGWALIMCCSEHAARALYNSIYGGKEKAPLNPYEGDTRVYAMLISPIEGTMHENS